jgi:hypothetical protein
MTFLTAEQQQAVIEGKAVEIRAGEHVFYVISKEQFELWQELRATIEDVDPSFYEAEDICHVDERQ